MSLVITQADLDATARYQFEQAKWDPRMLLACGACRYDKHDECRRWDTVLIPQLPPITAGSHLAVTIATREELHICGCDCPTARKIQGLKSQANTIIVSAAGRPNALDWLAPPIPPFDPIFASGTRYADAIRALGALRASGQLTADRTTIDSMRETEVGDQAEIDRAAKESVTKPPSVPLDEAGRPLLFPSPRVTPSVPPAWQREWRTRRLMFGGDLDQLERWEAEQRALRAILADAYDVDPALLEV